MTGFLTSGVLKGLGDYPLLSDSVIISDWPSTGGEFLDFKEVKVREIGRQQKRSLLKLKKDAPSLPDTSSRHLVSQRRDMRRASQSSANAG